MKILENMWIGIVWVLAQLYRVTILLMFNVVFNLYYLFKIKKEGKQKEVDKAIRYTFHGSKNFEHVAALYKEFKYKHDGLIKKAPCKLLKIFEKWPTWTACMRVIAYMGSAGNCQDSNIYAKFLINANNHFNLFFENRKIKYKTRIYVPLSPRHWDKVHYFLSVYYAGEEYLYSNGVIYTEKNKDWLAHKILGHKIKYVWL